MSRGMDLNSLIEEAQQMLTTVGDVLTSTMQQGVEVIKNYEEIARNKVTEITESKKKELADLSVYEESVRSCVEINVKKFEDVEDKLRKELAVCYKKNYSTLDKISIEKSTIHEEALMIKNELQEAMTKCMLADNKIECFLSVLSNLKKKLNVISSKVGEIMRKETEARVKASKAVYECDQKAVDEAYKKCGNIINDVKKCTEKKK